MKSFFVALIVISFGLIAGYTTMAHADAAVTYCDCILKPIDTDAKHAACSKMTELLGAQERSAERRACLENVPVPAGGPDVCFCMKSRSKDPALRKTCQSMLKTLSNSQFMSKSRECIYK